MIGRMEHRCYWIPVSHPMICTAVVVQELMNAIKWREGPEYTCILYEVQHVYQTTDLVLTSLHDVIHNLKCVHFVNASWMLPCAAFAPLISC